MSNMKKLQATSLSLLLLSALGFAGCNSMNRPQESAVRPVDQNAETPVSERPESEYRNDDREVMGGDREGVREQEVSESKAAHKESAELFGVLDRENDLRKAILDLQFSAKENDLRGYARDVDNAYNRLEAALRDMSEAAMVYQASARPVAEKPKENMLGQPEIPAAIDEKLKLIGVGIGQQLQQVSAKGTKAFTRDVAKEKQRWMAVADVMDTIQKDVPNAQGMANTAQIRSLANSLSSSNFQNTELQLFEKTHQSINKLTSVLENQTLQLYSKARTTSPS